MNMQIKTFMLAMTVALVSQMGAKAQPPPEEGKKLLVAYFSHTGNTRAIARMIQVATGADAFEIVPANPYPESYADVLARGRQELQDDVRPELKTAVPDIAPYDVVFVGSPNWFNTIVPPVMTFLSGSDFSGKTIVPFMTHGGGGLGKSVQDVKRLAPGATLLEGRAFRGDAVEDAGEDVRTWLRELRLVE
mgnify:CR=1 FL=1